MSFREKSAWVCLWTMAVVYVPYFGNVFRLFARGRLEAAEVLGEFIGVVVLQVLLLVGAHIVIAVLSRRQQPDERDRAIELRSFRAAYTVLVTACTLAVCGVVALAVAPGLAGSLLAPTFLSQAFLLCVVLAEATKYLTQVVSYRRGL